MTATARLRELRDRQWDDLLDEHPEHAISVGYPTRRAWTDWSDEGIARRRRADQDRLAALEGLDEAALDVGGRVDRQVAVDGLRRTLAVGDHPNEMLAVDQVNGPQVWIPNALADLAPTLAGDADPFLERLAAVPDVVEAMVGHLRRGVASGITLPRVVAALVPPQIDQLLTDDALAARFVEPLAGVAPSPVVDRALRLAREVVAPALDRLAGVYRDEYLPAAQESVGLGHLPDGETWYDALARWYTTTDLTPAQLQELGRSELAVIGDRMGELAGRLAARGVDVDEPGASSPAALVAAYDELCRRIDTRLPELFATLPDLGFEVVEMPAAIAGEAPAAYYVPGSARAGRPGRFQVNTTQLPSRPRREAVALAMHECIPGHHLQFALAQENDDLAPIRRHAHVDAYIEGWALYAESLAADLGLFDDDPLAEYGALTFAAWRAARLVVDPGLHVFGWTRDQAVDFMVAETARPRADLAVEVDRYLAWPGQALGYKVGELAIRELRRRADAAGVDRRGFHDQVLGHGAVPLAVLDDVVGAWIGSPPSC